MSTESVKDEAEAAIASLTELSEKAKERAKELKKTQKENSKKREGILHGTHIALQRVADEDASTDHELQQLVPDVPLVSLGAPTPVTAPASPEPTVVNPPVGVVPEPEPVITEPQPIPPVVEEPPTVVLNAPVAPEAPVAPPNQFNPREWNWRSGWWLIVLFGLLGIFVASLLWGWFVQDWFLNHDPKWLVAGIILSIIHWVGWPVVGIFTGGYISRRIEERHQNNPPPVQPAAPHAA